MKHFCLALLLCLAACTPTPWKVSDAIGRGELEVAVQRLAALVNDTDLQADRLNKLLASIAESQKFSLKLADDLFDRLHKDKRERILAWYAEQHLAFAEAAMRESKFDKARDIWRRYQKRRNLYFPKIPEPTPVLGIIDLREAEYLARRKRYPQARAKWESARKSLSQKKPFDRVRQESFQRYAHEVEILIKKGNPSK